MKADSHKFAGDIAFIVTGETENDAKIKSINIMKQEQDWHAANSFLINSNKT